jgi:two-component system sensor histidine kinase KdpD
MPTTEETLAATAHELRLPLSHIKGFVTSLRRTDVDWGAETQSEFFAQIGLETDRLAELVDSLLAAHTRRGSHKPATDLAFIYPANVVQGGLERIRGLFGERPLRLDVPPTLPSFQVHANQMERVLANLIQNAIKYSPPGSPISISARITHAAELEFTVEDEGPGIPEEDRERIFEPFFRNHTAAESEVSGHGLGLAICQSIVLAHRGRIEVADRPAGGARFSVFLPARAGQFAGNYQSKDRRNDPASDPAKRAHSRRRGTDAQAARQQSQGQRLRRTGSG